MARSAADEISILCFFETESIDKAELLYKIVAEKMRERLGRDRKDASRSTSKDTGASRRRRTSGEGNGSTQPEVASTESAQE